MENTGIKENHIMPFLWVHGEDEATYRKMVGVIYEANIREFCVEARPHDGFCGEQWWKDMDIILDEAESRGMRVWILDDKHFPTGYANGEVLNAPLELRRQGIFVKKFPIKKSIHMNIVKKCHPPILWKGNMTTQLYMVTDIMNKNRTKENTFHDDCVYSVSAIRTDKEEEPIDLMGYVKEGILIWHAPEGEWEVHLCCLSRNIGTHRSYINMMEKESCKILLDAVYEPHYAHYKDKFGTVIAGFFSDEPELGNNYMYRMYNLLGTDQDLPWSKTLEQGLRETLGDSFQTYLPLLWDNHGDAKLTAKVRYAYMDCVSRLVEDAFSKQIGTWCREHGVEYIGHVVEDNNQHARTGTSLGHYFRGLKWQSMAGIDDIGGQVYPGGEDKFNKHPLGYNDDGEFYHYTLGKLGSSLGAINPHMKGRTMCEIFGNYGWSEGVRLEKYLLDHFMVRGINYFVPHAFTCSPYPEKDCPPHFYAQGNNPQYRHFGSLMNYAERICSLLSHGRSITPVAVLYHGEAEWTGKYMLMQKPARILADNQMDFHFLPADVFAEREFYHTKLDTVLSVNGNEYQVFVIPYAQFITKETADAVIEMMDKGMQVWFMDNLPEGLCDGALLPQKIKNAKVVSLDSLADEVKALSLQTVTLLPENNRIRALHYKTEKDVYYLVNEGQEEYVGDVVLPLNEQENLCIYDAWNDRYEQIEVKNNSIHVSLHPSHSLILIVGENHGVEKMSVSTGKAQLLTEFKQSICRSIEYPSFHDEEQIHKLESYSIRNPKFSGYIRYETDFSIENIKTVILEITDAYEGVEVFVNEKSAGVQVVPPFRYDISKLCQTGKNKLIIEVATTLERERGNHKKGAPTGITGEVRLIKA